MIASTVLVLTAGRLSDLFGRKRAYVAGFVVFALASLGAGFAADGTQLILWRIVQGIGGAFLFANAAALVTDAFPKEQLGLAMGTNTMVAAVGLVLGPVLGGALVAISWHWVFWFNVPFGLAGGLWGALVLRELAKPDSVRGFDLLGTTTFVSGSPGWCSGSRKGGLGSWDDPVVIGGLVAAVVLLPLFVLIEARGRAPMLDLTIFRDRLFAAAAGAAFINGLSRFALMFLFVFYFQGAQGDDPITAGIKLAPLALGMLVSSPAGGDLGGPPRLAAAGRRRDGRQCGRARAHDDAAGPLALLAELAVAPARRDRLGHVQLAEHRGDDGHRPGAAPRHRRRRAHDAAEHGRGHLDRLRPGDHDQRGAPGRHAQDLLRHHERPRPGAARPLHPQPPHGALGPGRDLARSAPSSPSCGRPTRPRRSTRRPSARRSGHERRRADPRAAGAAHRRGGAARGHHAADDPLLRGDRPAAGRRRPRGGRHRSYGERDVERLRDALRLRDLLGLTLEELKDVVEAEEARAALREEWHPARPDARRRREIAAEALGHLDRQLALVRRRRDEIDALEEELEARRARLRGLLDERG